MSRTLTEAERRPWKGKNGTWFYVGPRYSSFHAEHNGSHAHVHRVSTKAIRRALALMDRQIKAKP